MGVQRFFQQKIKKIYDLYGCIFVFFVKNLTLYEHIMNSWNWIQKYLRLREVDSHDGSQGQQPDPDNNGSHDRRSVSENSHDRPRATAKVCSRDASGATFAMATIK